MSVNTLHDKFIYHLEAMYYVENQLVDVLDQIASDVSNEDLHEALEEHREQTKRHIKRLEDVFAAIGEQPEQRPSPVFDALLEERKQFLEVTGPDEDMRDLHDLGAVAKNEHVEIAGYENLIMLARKLDLSSDVRDALEDNLDDEKETKQQLKAMADDSAVRKLFARLAG